MMKYVLTFLLPLLISQVIIGQAIDTLRIYDHLKPGDRWKLQIENNKSFTLFTNKLFFEDDTISSGICRIDKTSIQFRCNEPNPGNKNLTERLKQFSNSSSISSGDQFPMENNILIPRNIIYATEDSLEIPKGIYAKYYRGDGFGSYIIELKEDGTYVFFDNSCVAFSREEGTWKFKGGLITFKPKKDGWSKLEWVTQDNKFYLTDNYLIGKKTTKTISSSTTVIETFFYLSKEPN